jgi:hypothetical protein
MFRVLLLGVVLLSAFSGVQAEDAYENICKKLQMCTMQELEKEMGQSELPAEMQDMLKAQVQNMCVGFQEKYMMLPEAKLKKCMQEIEKLSCDELMNDADLPACEAVTE